MNNIYYVYEWYNVDTGIIFYVGKGKNNRAYSDRNRNKFFLDYKKFNNVDVRFVKINLSEDDAWKLEEELIAYYWSINQCFTNFHPGGKSLCWNKGKKFDEEYANKRRQTPEQHKTSKKVIRTNIETNESTIYGSLNFAARSNNIRPSYLSMMCHHHKPNIRNDFIYEFYNK